ncbi:DUF2617 family protein [Micromonospora sp. NPDC049559]|uniref:DUF2617 family protein n=1 Tax=Micromonospora sp. NPDC049559 TaxID=3155923 RepID=UPI00343291CC
MIVTLDTPYADSRAADLSLTLDDVELPALHGLDVTGPGRVVVGLRLLGASHQVLLTAAGTGRTETVACLPGTRPSLPGTLREPDGRYHFSARVLRFAGAEFGRRVAALRAALADDPAALVGVFPGGPEAITALRVRFPEHQERGRGGRGGTVGWRTWHAYPQAGELVRTATVVRW